MKKRTPAKSKPSPDRSLAKRAAARAQGQRLPAKGQAENDYGYPDTHIVVTEEQFQFLLDLIEKPVEVSEELRREVANRRWRWRYAEAD